MKFKLSTFTLLLELFIYQFGNCQAPEVLVPVTNTLGLEIQKVCLSPDLNYAITTDDFALVLWDAKTNRSVRKIDNYQPVKSPNVSFSPSSDEFIVGSSKSVGLYKSSSGRLIRSIDAPDFIYAAFFLKGGSEIVTVCRDTIMIFETSTGQYRRSLPPLFGVIDDSYISIDQQSHYIYAQFEHSILRLDAITGEKTRFEGDQEDNQVSAFTLSKSGKYLAVNYKFGDNIIFSVDGSVKKRRLGLPINASVGIKPDGSYGDTLLRSSREFRSTDVGSDNVFFLDDSTLLQQDNYTFIKWHLNRPNSEPRRTRMPFRITKDAVKLKNDQLLLVGQDSVEYFDLSSLTVTKRIKLPKKISYENYGDKYGYYFCYDEPSGLLLATDSVGLNPLIINLKTGKLERYFNNRGLPELTASAFYHTADKDILFTASDDFCLGWDLKKAEPVFKQDNTISRHETKYFKGNEGTKVNISPSGKYLLVGYNFLSNPFTEIGWYTLNIYDNNNYKHLKTIDSVVNYQMSDNDILLYQQFASKKFYDRIYNFSNTIDRVVSVDTLYSRTLAISTKGKYMVSIKKDTTVETYDLVNNQRLGIAIYKNWREGINEVTFSPDGELFAISGTEATEIPLYRSASGTKIKTLKPPRKTGQGYEMLSKIYFNSSGNRVYGRFGWTYEFDIANGMPKVVDFDTLNTLLPDDHLRVMNGYNQGTYLAGQYLIATQGWATHVIDTTKIKTGGGSYFFYTLNADNSLVVCKDYYKASRGAAKLLTFALDDKVYSFDQLDMRYNRPDLVLQQLGCPDSTLINTYHRAYEKRIKALDVDTTAFKNVYSAPEADFVDRDKINSASESQKITLHIKGNSKTSRISRFNVWVNQVPLYGSDGIHIKNTGKSFLDTIITVTLSDGENKLETSVFDINGMESYHIPLSVRYAASKPHLPKLYFVGIGIDRFSNSAYNLDWSVKDIRDLAFEFKTRYGNRCVIDTLFNQNVILANVINLKKKLLTCDIDDKVIIAYSGHGLLSKSYDYFLSAYDVNFNTPEVNGIPYDAFENLLDGIPARKKLMLIDACNSGGIDKQAANIKPTATGCEDLEKLLNAAKASADERQVNSGVGNQKSFQLMQQLFVNIGHNTGATIIAASAGNQHALANKKLKNGVFTYSILETLKNDHCTLSILKQHINRRVPELSNGLQVPAIRSETEADDWEL